MLGKSVFLRLFLVFVMTLTLAGVFKLISDQRHKPTVYTEQKFEDLSLNKGDVFTLDQKVSFEGDALGYFQIEPAENGTQVALKAERIVEGNDVFWWGEGELQAGKYTVVEGNVDARIRGELFSVEVTLSLVQVNQDLGITAFLLLLAWFIGLYIISKTVPSRK